MATKPAVKKKKVVKKSERLLSVATPAPGWKDTLVRALKTFIAGIVAGIPTLFVGVTIYNEQTGGFNIPINTAALIGLIVTSGTTAGSILLNKVLTWSQS